MAWVSLLIAFLPVVSAAADAQSIYAIDLPVRGECGQIDISNHKGNQTALSTSSQHPLCNVWSISGCGVAAAAAAVACGGPLDPADAGCILGALAAIPTCGPCLCSTVHCPKWCPCHGNSAPSDPSRVFQIGTCEEVGYAAPAGKKYYNVSYPVPGKVEYSLFKRSITVV